MFPSSDPLTSDEGFILQDLGQKNKEMIHVMEKMIKQIGNVEVDGEVYIHTPDQDDVASMKGKR